MDTHPAPAGAARCALAMLACLLPALAGAAHPNNSIAPRIPPATPYGYNISLSNDPRRRDGERAPVPAETPLPLMDYHATEAQAGAYTAALIEPAGDLGRALQARGDHREALPYLRRAIHLARVNEGLATPTQLPLLERVLASQLALGDRDGAAGTQRYLLRLRLANAPDEAARQAAVAEYADWQRGRYLAREGFETYRFLVDLRAVNERELERLEAAEAAGTPAADLARLPYLRDMLRTEYLVSRYEGERKETIRMRAGSSANRSYAPSQSLEAEDFRLLRKYNYRGGRQLAERIIEIHRAQPEPDRAALARALLDLGDWHLWWHQPGSALRSYREAWNLYANDGDPATDPAALFPAPRELPVASPFFTAAPPPDEHLEPAEGQARFKVNRLGQARDVELAVLEARDAEAARTALYRMLKEFRFRPVLRGGDAVESGELTRRYSYRY
ncbi:MAG: hypothetical protein ACX93N_13310 [Pseudohaliea sp.]